MRFGVLSIIPVYLLPRQVDHRIPAQVEALFEQVKEEQSGQLDILVNDIWGGGGETWGQTFWEHDVEAGLVVLERAIHTHIITSRYGTPLMLARRQGLIIEIGDGLGLSLLEGYRGNFYYDLVKTTVIRMAYIMSEELKPHNITAFRPDYLRHVLRALTANDIQRAEPFSVRQISLRL